MNESLREALRHGAECPPAETLIGVLEHGEEGDRAGFESHVRSCAACQTELAMYRGFEAGTIGSDEREAVNFIVKRVRRSAKEAHPINSIWRRFFTPAWIGGTAVAMAAMLLAVGLTSQWRAGSGNTAVSDDRALRTNAITITSLTGDVDDVPGTIQWQPVDGAAEYTVNLSEVDGTVFFHKNITSPQVLLPEETRIMLKLGKRVLLDVSAENRAGVSMARSGKVSIRLKPAATQSH